MKQIFIFLRIFRDQLELKRSMIQKAFAEQNHFEETKRKVFVAIPFWIAGICTALAATLYARGFQLAEEGAISIYDSIGYWTLAAVPALFVLSLLVVEIIAPFANGSGIPQLMAAAEISARDSSHPLLDKLLGLRVIFAKVVSSIVGVIAGGAIGREGPTLQISASIFHLTDKVFSRGQISKNHHGMMLAGGAAGLAAAFNTPLGGIAYVVEELSRSHLSSFRTGVLHAVIMAGIFAQIAMGPYLYFGYPKVAVFEFTKLGFVIVYAALAGLIAALFAQSLKRIVEFRATLTTRQSRLIFAAICGFVFAAIVLVSGHSAIGSGRVVLNRLLFSNDSASITEVVSRVAGTIATYGAGGAGGIFAPTLAIGGSGASYLDLLMGGGLGPLSVLVGMTAGLAALTHSPFTSFVLILEMTDRHSAIVPLMIAALIGQGLAKSVSKTSFYEFVCHRILVTNNEGQERAKPI